MKRILLFLFLGATYYANSQILSPEVIVSSSGNLSNSQAQISWTLGDTQTRTYKVGELIITQGFLQSNLLVTEIIDISKSETLDLSVYPNPVKDVLNIKFSAEQETIVHFELYSLEGKLVYKTEIGSQSHTANINFEQFESGTYLLKAISVDKKFIKTFKVFYQD